MYCGRLHGEYRTSAIFDKLVDDSFGIVVFTIGETGKGAHSDEVAIATHHGNGFEQVLTLVAIHNHSTFGLQFPCTGIHVEHDDVHTEIHCCLLGGKACAQ